jgi:uncharacterized membrane protein
MDSVEKQPVEQPAQAIVQKEDPPVVAKTSVEKPGVPRENPPGAERLLVLCDGIFAIATTLLVIDIKIPSNLSETAFNNALSNLLFSQAIIYLITFVVIASFWAQHRRVMHYVNHFDSRFISLTLLFLAFIAFFPVTSTILNQYSYLGAIILYTLTFAGCGFSLLIVWLYASWHHRLLEPDLPRERIASLSIGIALTPVYFSLSLLLLFTPLNPPDIFYSWLLLPFITLLFHMVRRRRLTQSLGKLVSHQPNTH